MLDTALIPLLHQFVRWLLVPTLALLAVLVALALWEIGVLVGERVRGLQTFRRHGTAEAFETYGRRRIERADILTRVAPMLGLMGTLIPLGPGIAALSRGNFQQLAEAVSVAFDTTVIGLAVGVVGFVIGRLRRRWYDHLIAELEPHRSDFVAVSPGRASAAPVNSRSDDSRSEVARAQV